MYRIEHYSGDPFPWYVKDAETGLDYGRYTTYTQAKKRKRELKEIDRKREDDKMAGYQLNDLCRTQAYIESARQALIDCTINPPKVVSTGNSTACCAPCTPCYPKGYGPKTEEKESTMYNDYNSGSANLETQQRNHLKRRLDDAFQSKKQALKTKFNINYDATPKTLQGLKDMISAGNIKIDESMFTAEGKFQGWGRVMDTLSFIDPTKVADEASYKTARADLETKLQAAKDIALVAPLADGLKALQDFEALTF